MLPAGVAVFLFRRCFPVENIIFAVIRSGCGAVGILLLNIQRISRGILKSSAVIRLLRHRHLDVFRHLGILSETDANLTASCSLCLHRSPVRNYSNRFIRGGIGHRCILCTRDSDMDTLRLSFRQMNFGRIHSKRRRSFFLRTPRRAFLAAAFGAAAF